MLQMSDRTKLPYLKDFTIAETPTKLIPLRLIHSFSCLPIIRPSINPSIKERVLVLDNNEVTHDELKSRLELSYDLSTSSTIENGLKLLSGTGSFAAVFVSNSIYKSSPISIIDEIQKLEPLAKVILICYKNRQQDSESFQASMKAVKQGRAVHVLTKPLEEAELDLLMLEHFKVSEKKASELVVGKEKKIDLLTVWPPTKRMNRWVYAVSGCMQPETAYTQRFILFVGGQTVSKSIFFSFPTTNSDAFFSLTLKCSNISKSNSASSRGLVKT